MFADIFIGEDLLPASSSSWIYASSEVPGFIPAIDVADPSALTKWNLISLDNVQLSFTDVKIGEVQLGLNRQFYELRYPYAHFYSSRWRLRIVDPNQGSFKTFAIFFLHPLL